MYFAAALALFTSGLLVTLAGALFSVQGLLLILPDKDLFIPILALAIAFEIAKISLSVFLFHNMSNKAVNVLFKFYMTMALLALMLISAISMYTHLNKSLSESMIHNKIQTEQEVRIKDQISQLIDQKRSLDDQMANLPANFVNGRSKLLKEFGAEKTIIDDKLKKLEDDLANLKLNSKSNDLNVLTSLATTLNVPIDVLFSSILLIIISLIDPLALSLILAGSYVLLQHSTRREEKVLVTKEGNDIITTSTVKETTLDHLETHIEEKVERVTLPTIIKPEPEKPMVIINEEKVNPIQELKEEEVTPSTIPIVIDKEPIIEVREEVIPLTNELDPSFKASEMFATTVSSTGDSTRAKINIVTK
jgi:hypothetical protein